ncbi:MAG: argininosuccinate synthase [Bacteriovoracaceae bacterium]|nr:argininosuccinate synthase [Bacteriovoracaceae bacterium]
MSSQKILLAFSGGLDTSAIIPWLKDTYNNPEIVAYCADLGNAPDGEYLEKWSKQLGASSFIFEDLKDRFAQEFAFPCVRAGAIYQDDYLLGTAIGRPLIAERMAFFAKKLNCDAIAHGATGKGNDQLRFEKSWAYLVPDIKVIAPWKEWSFTGRKELIAFLATKGINFENKEKLFSVDVNLFHRSCEGGVLENVTKEYDPSEVYEWVATPAKSLKDAVTVTVGFKDGMPTTLNGDSMGPAALLTKLNQVAGAAGIGVLDLVEERTIGLKSRGVYETPGGTLLHLACKNLKHLTWDRELLTVARNLSQAYAQAVYDGHWYSPVRMGMEAFFTEASKTLTGEVTLKLEGGQARVVARNSAFALYDEAGVSFEIDKHQMHKHALGYSKTVSYGPWKAGQRDAKMNIAPVLK